MPPDDPRAPKPTEQSVAIARAVSRQIEEQIKPELVVNTAATERTEAAATRAAVAGEGIVTRVDALDDRLGSVEITVARLDERSEGQEQVLKVVHDNTQRIADVTLAGVKARTESEELERRLRASNAAHAEQTERAGKAHTRWWLREVTGRAVLAILGSGVVGAVLMALASRRC